MDTIMPLPLIIVPVFNALEHLEACLDSITRTVPTRHPGIVDRRCLDRL